MAAAILGSVALADVVDKPDGFVLRSNNAIQLEGNVFAGGFVGAVKNVEMGWGSKVDGKVEIGADHSWFDPVINPWAVSKGKDVSLGWAESRTLTAGSYGNLTTNSSNSILLSGAGNYMFKSFQLGWSGTVTADTSKGDVYVYVNGPLTAADSTRFQTKGDGKLFLMSMGDISFGYQSNVQAAVYSGGDLSFGGSSSLVGFGFAEGSISAGYGANFSFVPVPAPGVAALFALAGGCAGRARRRRT
jgi:hypothetical protein